MKNSCYLLTLIISLVSSSMSFAACTAFCCDQTPSFVIYNSNNQGCFMTWSRVTTTEGTMKNAPSYPISSGLEAGYTTPPFIPASTTSAASGFLVNLQVVCKLSGINSYKFISGSLNYSFTENAGTCTAPPEDNLFQVDNFITTTQVIVGSKGPIVKFVLGNGKL